jgi:hypothetical protein
MSTQRAQFKFIVKDGATPGLFFIAAEPVGEFTGLEGFGGYLGFNLQSNTTHEKARKIAEYLN